MGGTWAGGVTSSFATGEDVLDWVLHTGAGAGFDLMMDAAAKAESDRRFVEVIEADFMRDGAIEVVHEYACAIGWKGGPQ